MNSKILIEGNCIFLSMDLTGMDLYQKGKARKKFINDTTLVEEYADTMIRNIMRKYGIIVTTTDKNVLRCQFDTLKRKGITIEIVDFYKNLELAECEYITTTKNGMTIILEEEKYLLCGVEVKEIIND